MTDSAPQESRPRPVDFVPRRVVSLVPSITESLFDLELGDRLIGVTDYCVFPAEGTTGLPKMGGTKNPDIAQIVALRPDLVMMNSEENRKADADALRAAGIPIWASEPRTVRDALDLLWLIMDVFEGASMVHRVRQIEIMYETTLRYMVEAEGAQPVRTFAPIWREPWMTFNRHTYTHDLLRTCGAANVFADRERDFPLAADLGESASLAKDDPRRLGRDTRYPRVTLEEIADAQPELVLLPSEPFAFDEVDAARFHQLDIPAAHNSHIYLIEGSLLTWHGTRLAYALRDLPPVIEAVRMSRQ